MIIDKSEYTSTIYFPKNVPHISLNTYDYCEVNVFRPWFSKRQFQTLIIDINQSEGNLLSSYQYRVRRYVKKASGLNLEFNTHQSGEQFYDLQDSVVQSNQHVKYYPHSLLTPSIHRLFTTIQHPQHGILAMHGHLLDSDSSQCLLSMNISRYREFREPGERQLAGMANTYLFHRDFLHFKELGYTHYDMGGFEVPALKRFKKGFGGSVKCYYRYHPYFTFFIRKIKKYFQ